MVHPDTFLCDSVEMWSAVDPMTIAANRLCRMVIAVKRLSLVGHTTIFSASGPTYAMIKIILGFEEAIAHREA